MVKKKYLAENPSLQVHLPLTQNPFMEQLFLQAALKQNYS